MSKVPISELPETLSEQGRIAWQLQLPEGVNSSNLLLRSRQVSAAMRWGGLGGLVVHNAAIDPLVNEPASRIEPIPVGADRAVESVRLQVNQAENQLPYRSYRWPIAHIGVDLAKVEAGVKQRYDRGMPKQTAWAKGLRSAMRHGLNQAMAYNLCPTDKIFPAEMAAIIGGANLADVRVGSPGAVAAHTLLFQGLSLWGPLSWQKQTGVEGVIKQRRWSIAATSFQPDRLAVAALVANHRPLIQPSKG